MFMTGRLLTDLVVCAYFSVERVSSKLVSLSIVMVMTIMMTIMHLGDMQAIIIVLALPPRES